jgi:hypothetical protein
MKVATTVLVDGAPIHFASWKAGYPAGSPLQVFVVEPLMPATIYDPEEITEPHPVEIQVSIDGHVTNALKNGHLDATHDQVANEGQGHSNTISGQDQASRLFQEGPRRDVVFVPRGIVEQVYPRGVLIRTLAGESVVGLPPGVNPRLFGPFGSRLTSIDGIPGTPSGGSTGAGTAVFGAGGSSGGIGAGPPLAGGPFYQMITEVEFLEVAADECVDDNRYGVTEDWINTVPPLIVIIGAATGILTGSGTGGGGAGSVFGGGAAGAPGASVNALVTLIGKKVGFDEVLINTPDLGMAGSGSD